MSGTDYTQTPNLRLFKPIYDMAPETWGDLLNSNADTLDNTISTLPVPPSPSNTVPPMDGLGSAGTSTFYARADHAHPHDTTMLPLSGGTMTGPLNVTPSGANTILRSVQDQFADVANIRDFDGGPSNDDALRLRRAIASGKSCILIPPGTYTFKTLDTVPGPMNWQPTPCVLFNGVNNLTVLAHGATFMIDDAATFPDAGRLNAGNAHCGFIGDCHHVTWKGGRFYGNTTNAGTAINTGMWFQNCTQFLIEDTEWLGDYHVAPIFGGVWLFEFTFRNNRSYGSGNGHDFAWVENMTVENCVFDGNYAAGNAATSGYKLFTDPATKAFNTPGSTLAPTTWASTGAIRNLVGGLSNSVRIIGNRWNGWGGAVFIDGTYDVQIARNTVRNGWAATNGQTAPIYIATTSDTNALGFGPTRGISILDNDIYNNLTAAILFNPSTYGIGQIEIRGNRIYDNTCPQALLWGSTTSIGTPRIEENDFVSRAGTSVQAAIIDPAQLNAIRQNGGNFSRNLGAAPYMQTSSVMAINPGAAGVVSVSDGIHYNGMFNNGAGIAFGPCNANGTPASIWAALDSTGFNNIPIGGTTAAAGAFTTLSASGAVSGTGFNSLFASPPAIGGTAAAAGSFTTLTASGLLSGTSGRILSSANTNSSIGVSDTTNAAGLFISGGQLNFGPLSATTAGPTASWGNFTSAGALFITTGRVTSELGGGAGCLSCYDGTHSLGMFNNGAGLAWGPCTPATGAPTALIAGLDSTGNFTAYAGFTVNNAGPTIRAGTGAPTGTQPKGSIWLRTDGAAGSTLYVTQGGGTWNAVAGV